MSSGPESDTGGAVPPPRGTTYMWGRPKVLLLAGGLVLVGAAVAVILLIGGGRPEVDASQFQQVGFGDTKEDVAAALGGEGESGSHEVSGAPTPFEDCWFYTAVGPKSGSGDEVVVCFEQGEVVSVTSPF
jgi:hypothetical protein